LLRNSINYYFLASYDDKQLSNKKFCYLFYKKKRKFTSGSNRGIRNILINVNYAKEEKRNKKVNYSTVFRLMHGLK